MPASTEPQSFLHPSHQEQFHQRWNHLTDRHVRTLAWLLDAPDLLDATAPEWSGRVASLGPVDQRTAEWLAQLDSSPQALHAYLGVQAFTRLGRYAEKLMAYFLESRNDLVAHGVQVRMGKNATIGEFDFLLRQGEDLVHWEFATKLYLLESSGRGHRADYFVGPNLADTLGAKVRKIMDQQLTLSQHPAAQAHLPEPIARAQALVKGWLFYHGQTPLAALPEGISLAHCRGFWCPLEETAGLKSERYVVLPRLDWLAPAKTRHEDAVDYAELRLMLETHFAGNTSPVLVALLQPCGDVLLEIDRGFIVPDDWQRRAAIRIAKVS
ncbi:DUF1853 family protein [Noviherbaspirillum saxi]|uniref:DUF1853 family protein n=1 Tax=Noviherbaspirillum saxi TaxID=2320863 RepID=A0A3A3FT49_9BURK|nr:DUF1853 family protein [Noviherbaspirillum saxi]RJF98444.1 DUF1853 family protein [Noviherbaspirillum saxi]